MATKRHRTVIQVDVDDRNIRGLDQTLHRAFDDQMLATFEKVIERSAKQIEAMQKSAEAFEKTMERVNRHSQAAGKAGGQGATGSGGAGDVSAAIRTLSANIQQLSNAMGGSSGGGGGGGSAGGGGGPSFGSRVASTAAGTYLGSVGRSMSQEGFLAQAAGGIPIIGGFIQGAINSAHRYAGQYGQAQTQISRQAGMLGRRNAPNQSVFSAFGFAKPEAMGQATQMAQMAGLAGSTATPEFMKDALEMQMLGGIREAPGIVRAAGVGGGMTMQTDMFEAVSAGVQMGVREARLGQFVGAATQVLEQARLGGTDTNLQTVLRTFAGFSGLGAGFHGEQGQQFGAASMNALRNFRPGNDVASLVGLRAVGFGTEGGPSYHEALQQFQEDPAAVMPRVIQQIRAMAPGDEAAQMELMGQVGERFFGGRPSVRQLQSLVRGNTAGFGQEVSAEAGRGHIEQRRQSIGSAFGVAAQEASMQNARLGVGAQVYERSRELQTIELNTIGAVVPKVMAGIDKMIEYLKGLYEVYQQEGVGGVVRVAFEDGMAELKNMVLGAIESTGMQRPAQRIQQGASEVADFVANPLDYLESGYNVLTGGFGEPNTTSGGTPAGQPAAQPSGGDGDLGPTSNAAGYLRRMGRDANTAADLLERQGLPVEGQLAYG